MKAARLATGALPFLGAVLVPVIPLLVQLADVEPRGVAIGGRTLAASLAWTLAAAGAISLTGLLFEGGPLAFVRAPLALPMGAVLASEILAGFAGVAPRAGAFEIVSSIGCALCFVLLWWMMANERIRRAWLAGFLGSSLLASVFAVALTLTKHPPAAFAYVHGRAAGTFLQPNEFAGYLLFAIPLGLAQIAAPAPLRRLGLAAAAVGAVGLALSVSRAAWFGLLIGLPVFAARLGRRALAGYGVAALLAILLGATALRDVAHDPSENASRITVWRGAVRMAERFALIGVGPIAFSRAYPALKDPSATVDEVHAHDLPLNVLIENGVIGLCALGWFVVASLRAAQRAGACIPPAARERTLLFAALGAAFAASAVQNAVDVVTTFVLLLWWPMLGLLLALAREPAQPA